MEIIGIDFTSAPSDRKPITVAHCSLDGTKLSLQNFSDLASFDDFERFLSNQGESIYGIDFPFGQSRKFVENIGWPLNWVGYVSLVQELSRDGFIELLTLYKNARPLGDREHRRVCDELAGSISPQKLYGVPVGKMFFEGAKRILRSPANIPLLRPNHSGRTIIESYPALVARHFIGRSSYKSDTKKKQTDAHRIARQQLMASLRSLRLKKAYGLNIELSQADCDHCVLDPKADHLDALLCAVQAAWASTFQNYGIPQKADEIEGWICDPFLRLKSNLVT